MIPASYMFKDIYRNHWEVEAFRPAPKVVKSAPVPPAMPSGGVMRAAFRSLTRLVHHTARPAHVPGFGL